jgi:predicted alpha/beta superfamily hydrolase
VSLPLQYSDTNSYPVIYVLDAEWRFDMIRHMAFDMGGNRKIPRSIIVGIPHIDWVNQRGLDLTFSHSRIEYDGEAVDSSWYNDSNSGGGQAFFNYLTKELMPAVNQHYATNQHETLIGHSYGGYFGSYLLSMDQPFEVIHMYDPSIWYSDGEVITRFRNTSDLSQQVKVHITYQPEPNFHRTKMEEWIQTLQESGRIELSHTFYPDETHNALFLDSFYRGILLTNKY